MQKLYGLLLLSAILLFNACSYPVAKDANEFRSFFKKGQPLDEGLENYTVNRSLKEVTKSLERNADKCLKRTVYNEVASGMIITPTIKLYKNKTTIYVQNSMDLGPFGPGIEEQPEKGLYVVVVDVFSKGKKSVKVDFYKGGAFSPMFEEPITKIKAWIDGGDGCFY